MKLTKEVAQQMDKMLQTIIEQDKIIEDLKATIANLRHQLRLYTNN